MTDLQPLPDRLAARTVELDPASPVDLLGVAGDAGVLFEQDGAGLAGRGVALRIDLPAGLAGAGAVVAAALGAIAWERPVRRDGAGRGDRAGAGAGRADSHGGLAANGGVDGVGGALPAGVGPVAAGAFPFRPGAPASLVVPALTVRRTADGRQWLTTVGEGVAPRPPLEPAPSRSPSDLPDEFVLRSPRSHDDWRATVAEAIDAIGQGEFDKVVLAREVVVEANRPIVVADVVDRLRALYPSCTTFSTGGFVGATPELLASRRGREVRSHPLAGTYPRSGDPHADDELAAALLASAKDRWEHQLLVDSVAREMGRVCERLDVAGTPSILPLRNVLHLGTDIRGTLADPSTTVLDLVARLHPTPAVGGTPAGAALAWLDAHEGLDRSRYAGPVGWVDAAGDGEFGIGIRSAEIAGRRARLFAGVGVVEGSDPQSELAETQLKLQALLSALVRP